MREVRINVAVLNAINVELSWMLNAGINFNIDTGLRMKWKWINEYLIFFIIKTVESYGGVNFTASISKWNKFFNKET